jgi:hypothetical protein
MPASGFHVGGFKRSELYRAPADHDDLADKTGNTFNIRSIRVICG